MEQKISSLLKEPLKRPEVSHDLPPPIPNPRSFQRLGRFSGEGVQMKQITMDFETYEKEILAARSEGFEIVRELYKELPAALEKLGSHYSDKHYEGTRALKEIYYKLKEPIRVKELSKGET